MARLKGHRRWFCWGNATSVQEQPSTTVGADCRATSELNGRHWRWLYAGTKSLSLFFSLKQRGTLCGESVAVCLGDSARRGSAKPLFGGQSDYSSPPSITTTTHGSESLTEKERVAD